MKNSRSTFLLLICLIVNTTKPIEFADIFNWDTAKYIVGGLAAAVAVVTIPAAQGVGQEMGKVITEYWKDWQKDSIPEKYLLEQTSLKSQIAQANSNTAALDAQKEGSQHQAKQAELTSLKELLDALPKIYKDPVERELEKAKIIKKMQSISKKTINETEDNKLLSDKEIEDIKTKYKKNTGKKSEQTGLMAKLATSITFIQTTSGGCADFLANHSFAHITNLNCFKDTFIQTHAKHINRALVATTIVGIGFVVYKLYDKYTNADDDEYDNDKEDEDEQ